MVPEHFTHAVKELSSIFGRVKTMMLALKMIETILATQSLLIQ